MLGDDTSDRVGDTSHEITAAMPTVPPSGARIGVAGRAGAGNGSYSADREGCVYIDGYSLYYGGRGLVGGSGC